MPPVVQQRPAGETPPTVQTDAGTAASLAIGGDPSGRIGADRATDATGGGEPDRMSTDFPPESGTGYQTGPARQTEPEYGGGPDLPGVSEPPTSSAAVGRVIQRTLTLGRPAAQAADGSPARIPFGADRAAMPWPGSSSHALQRMPAFPGSVPVRAASYPATAALAGAADQGVVHPAAQDPVTLTLAAPMQQPAMDGLASQDQDFNVAVQRDSLPGAPDAAARPEAAPVTAPEASSAVEANRDESPAGPAAPASGRSMGAPGTAGAATPDQLEELAKRLAGPLIRRIKAEMLLDRERRGLRTDSN
ncbi:hypothetical protein [Arthrobacter sp. ZGTC131]|uniref:hypothetical protein n=1 Tax=Arthrobacter sp. ZGTC131 TaxID=2058898 RepID=UPI001CA5CBFE|nr:hypothetical protein [Arthrobacter sp. ZGTC131]